MDQVTALYALVSFLVLLIPSVSFSKSKSGFGPLVMNTRSSLFFEPRAFQRHGKDEKYRQWPWHLLVVSGILTLDF